MWPRDPHAYRTIKKCGSSINFNDILRIIRLFWSWLCHHSTTRSSSFMWKSNVLIHVVKSSIHFWPEMQTCFEIAEKSLPVTLPKQCAWQDCICDEYEWMNEWNKLLVYVMFIITIGSAYIFFLTKNSTSAWCLCDPGQYKYEHDIHTDEKSRKNTNIKRN